MNLNTRDQTILDFLHKPRTSDEIMNHLGHLTPPYGSLRLLQRLGLVEKVSAYERAKATFVATGTRSKEAIAKVAADPYISISAHNPFGL